MMFVICTSCRKPWLNSLTSVIHRVGLNDQSSLILKTYQQKEGSVQLPLICAVLLSVAESLVYKDLSFVNCLIKSCIYRWCWYWV